MKEHIARIEKVFAENDQAAGGKKSARLSSELWTKAKKL